MKKERFSLLEILVVVTIIALLVALLLPTLHTARENARRVSSGNNLKSIYAGIFIYMDENNEFFPYNSTGNADGINQGSLHLLQYKYLDSADVFLDPSVNYSINLNKGIWLENGTGRCDYVYWAGLGNFSFRDVTSDSGIVSNKKR